ncbi:MAG: tetratricopeptide repeat protein [Akkermansia sp.]|nr:tetratricopeptide repeat protein [Akkermansia sp.]
MKGSFSRSAFFSIAATLTVALSPCLVAQEASPEVQPETARRQMAMRDAMQEVQEARTAYAEKKYTLAVEHYRNALAVLPQAPAAEKQLTFIKDSLSDALIASAMDYRAVGRKDEAVSFLKEAMALSPKNERARRELLKTEDPQHTNPALTPQHVGDVSEVDRLLTLGYAQSDLGKFDEALAAFRQALTIDPYNTAARRGMESVQKRRSAYYATARDSARAAALSQVDALWEESVPQDAEITDAGAGQQQGEVLEDEEAQSRIAAALREMVLPQVTFDDAPVMDVIEALQAQIRRFETNGASSAGRAVNLTANFGLVGSEGYNDIMGRRVSLKLSDVSLTEVLDALARQLGITYHVTPLGVELSYSGKDFGPMVERVYTVSPHFFDAEVSDGGDDDDDDFSSSSSRVVVKRVNPVTALKEMGISFPEGSNARYDVGSRCLTVRNTPYNQEEIAGLLSVPLDEQARSVVLNVVAMEVNESDLNELGFEWLVNMHVGPGSWVGTGGVMSLARQAGWPEGGNMMAQDLVDTPTGSLTEGLRSGSQAISADSMDRLISTGSARLLNAANASTAKAPGILSLRGIWQAGDVTMIMRGLSQKKGTDILYNPRLVLTPGAEQQATFTNVREMFYPESYSEPNVFSSSMSMSTGFTATGAVGATRTSSSLHAVTATAAHPEEFTRFGMTEESVGGIGAVVQVHDAQIAQDGQLVTLALTVTLNDFEGFINWGTPIRTFMMTDSGDSLASGKMAQITLTENHILKPVFKRHMENTKISVAPGSVIVMGGVQEGRTVRYEDKLPILGDLPLVGRLFRSEGHEEKKKAFLFFVKVDVVDPTGRDPRTGSRPSDFSLAD